MKGLFDDLVPSAAPAPEAPTPAAMPSTMPPRAGGLFDDLLPVSIDPTKLGIDYSGPVDDVRKAIRALPKEQQDAAIKVWSRVRATKERANRSGLEVAGGHARAVARGTFVGPWLDEIQAGVSSLAHTVTGGAIGSDYDESVELQRAHDQAYDRENPYLGTALKIGGGLAGGLGSLAVRGGSLAARGAMSLVGGPWAAATPAAGAWGRIGQGIGIGGAHGANYGAGEAEGGFDAAGLKSRAGGAFDTGWKGAALGGALSPVMDVATGAARMAFKPAKERAEDLFALAATRDGPPGMDPAASLKLYGDRADRLTGISPSVRLADAGGENVGNLMRMATNVPNDMRESVRKVADVRAEHQWKRLEASLVREGTSGVGPWIGKDPRDFYMHAKRMADDLDRIGAQEIRPHLDKPTPMTAQLAEVLSRDPMKKIMDRVSASFSAEGRTVEALKHYPGRPPVGDTEFLFRLKLELDDLIGQTQRAVKMGNTPQAGHDLRALVTMKKDLLDAIPNPQFKAGLKTYATNAQLENALNDGREEFGKLQAEQLRMRLAELRAQSPHAERFYRFGALRAIIEDLRSANATNDRLKSVLGSPEMKLKLKELLPTAAAYRNFMRDVQAEKKMAFTRHKLQGNSTTAQQLGELQEGSKVGENAVAAGRMISNVAHGNWPAAIGNVMSRAASGWQRLHGITPAVASELLKTGMSRDPRTLERILSRSPTPVPDARTAILNALMAASSGAR